MLPAYEDIIAAAGRDPLWYDEHGVPRFLPFSPAMLSVYWQFAVYAEIGCQDCGKVFLVGMSWGPHDMMQQVMAQGWHPRNVLGHRSATVMQDVGPVHPTADNIGSWHYGDPPHHGCIGDTMNSVPRRIIEYWSRDYQRGIDKAERRHPEHEIAVREDWADGSLGQVRA